MSYSFQQLRGRASQRWEELTRGDLPWIRIGTALCGKAAGADRVADAFAEELKRLGIRAHVNKVGCLGLCFAEPLVDIAIPGNSRVVYGKVTPERVPEIIDSHLIKGEPITGLALGTLDGNEANDLPNLMDHSMMKRQLRIALRNAGNVDPSDIDQ